LGRLELRYFLDDVECKEGDIFCIDFSTPYGVSYHVCKLIHKDGVWKFVGENALGEFNYRADDVCIQDVKRA
jgi:hypothetical protein